MERFGSDGYLSVIGTSYIHPITTLMETLKALDPQGPNEVQASSNENGYSAAATVLSVLLCESALTRTQVIRHEKQCHPADFLNSAFPDSGLNTQIEELFVVRNAIAHNHVWGGQYASDWNEGMRLKEVRMRSGRQDSKYQRAANIQDRTTRILGLNLFPTRICFRDAIISVRTVTDLLIFLESKDRLYFSIEGMPVKTPSGVLLYTDWVKSLPRA